MGNKQDVELPRRNQQVFVSSSKRAGWRACAPTQCLIFTFEYNWSPPRRKVSKRSVPGRHKGLGPNCMNVQVMAFQGSQRMSSTAKEKPHRNTLLLISKSCWMENSLFIFVLFPCTSEGGKKWIKRIIGAWYFPAQITPQNLGSSFGWGWDK